MKIVHLPSTWMKMEEVWILHAAGKKTHLAPTCSSDCESMYFPIQTRKMTNYSHGPNLGATGLCKA